MDINNSLFGPDEAAGTARGQRLRDGVLDIRQLVLHAIDAAVLAEGPDVLVVGSADGDLGKVLDVVALRVAVGHARVGVDGVDEARRARNPAGAAVDLVPAVVDGVRVLVQHQRRTVAAFGRSVEDGRVHAQAVRPSRGFGTADAAVLREGAGVLSCFDGDAAGKEREQNEKR